MGTFHRSFVLQFNSQKWARLLLHLIDLYYLHQKRKTCCYIFHEIVHLMTNLNYPVLFFSSANHSLPVRLFAWCMGVKISELSVSYLQIFNLQSISIVPQKTCTWKTAFHLFSKNNLSPNADWDALQRQKNMHEIMFHVLKTKEKSLAKDVLASHSSNIITLYKNESPILLVCYTLI